MQNPVGGRDKGDGWGLSPGVAGEHRERCTDAIKTKGSAGCRSFDKVTSALKQDVFSLVRSGDKFEVAFNHVACAIREIDSHRTFSSRGYDRQELGFNIGSVDRRSTEADEDQSENETRDPVFHGQSFRVLPCEGSNWRSQTTPVKVQSQYIFK